MGFNTKVIFALSLFTHNCCNSSNYKEYDSRREKICTRQFDVGLGNHSSIIVKQFAKFDVDNDFECTFFVKTSFSMGLFAFIQKMNLRRGTDLSCIDYVQFRYGKKKTILEHLKPKRNEEWSDPICSPLPNSVRGTPSIFKETELKAYSFQQPEGEIEVKIHISRQNIHEITSKYLFEIVFTSYHKCKGDMGAYKSCGPGTCIYKDYFNDGFVNCPFLHFSDEISTVSDDENSFMGTKVAITAVSSIFLSFFLFLACLLMCRYMEVMCWSGNGVSERGTELSQVEPSAPPAPSSPDKDLPPAYETLFPQS